jgi:hypothetical protein
MLSVIPQYVLRGVIHAGEAKNLRYDTKQLLSAPVKA